MFLSCEQLSMISSHSSLLVVWNITIATMSGSLLFHNCTKSASFSHLVTILFRINTSRICFKILEFSFDINIDINSLSTLQVIGGPFYFIGGNPNIDIGCRRPSVTKYIYQRSKELKLQCNK